MTEREGHARANAFLRGLLGAGPMHLFWDNKHHMQGHVHLGNRDLVVIAPHDKVHEPIVLTAEDWDEIRHASGPQAGEMARQRAIHDHDRLLVAVR